jgi:hypothetical protein
MNARLYDAALGRFLSPDPLVQALDFSQSYNRYSYCVNNPLIYVDLLGYAWYNKFWNWLKENKKIVVTVVTIAVGVAVTVATAGAGSPVLVATLGGAAGGFAGGFTAGFSMGLIQSEGDFEYALDAGWKGGLNSAITGAGIGLGAGAFTGYKYAKANNLDLWSGKSQINIKSIGAKGTSVDVKLLNDRYLKQNGLDAHNIKYEYLGKTANVAKFDLYKASSGQIVILPKGGAGTPIYTDYIIE